MLTGKIFDDKNNYMSPAHSNKKGKRYRYYVSQAVIQHDKAKVGEITKIPAGDIETFVTNTIKELFNSSETLQNLFNELPIATQKEIITIAKNIDLTSDILRSIISKVFVFKENIKLMYYPTQIKELIFANYEKREVREVLDKTETTITRNMKIAIVYNGSKIIIGAKTTIEPNETFIKTILLSYKWNKMLVEGKAKNIRGICKAEKVTPRYVRYVTDFSALSPKIQAAIIKGTQPRDLTLSKLTEIRTKSWQEQEKLLNI